jgi:amino acid transporter
MAPVLGANDDAGGNFFFPGPRAKHEGFMAKSASPQAPSSIARVLDWKGASINAMALIAPGAFLWITYQLQAAATIPSGASCANDMWFGILLALALALLTALSYMELAKIYPEAGFAGAVYFAEKAFIDDQKLKRPGPASIARIAKLITGWAAHLFYWVYPGVMVAFFGTISSYLYTAFTGKTMTMAWMMTISWAFAFVVGYIAYRGVSGSTKTNLWGNIIQWVTLVIFSLFAIAYRVSNPDHVASTDWVFSGGFDIVKFHSLQGVLVQSTIAILILVGFESASSLAAETKEPEKSIPKAIIVALIVQCVFAYMFEYYAANYMVSTKLTGSVSVPAVPAVPAQAAIPATATSPAVPAKPAVPEQPATTKPVTGMDALANSSAPVGDMVVRLGDSFFGHLGNMLMIIMAITVVIAVIGTTLACMNTAVRVTAGMAEDRELPPFLGFIHTQNATPHMAIGLLVAVSCVIATIGVQSVVGLTGITLASNFGTFVLYGAVCIWTFIAYKKRPDFSVFKHGLIPLMGFVLNVVMCWGVIYLYTIGNADSQTEAKIFLYIGGGWALVWLLYVMIVSNLKSHGMKMISVIIRPDSLDNLAEALNKEELVKGMTVSEVKGFGRTLGSKTEDKPSKVKFLDKIRVDVVVNTWDVPHIIEVMKEQLYTGSKGDGKIFVLEADEAVRVRTGEAGVAAI